MKEDICSLELSRLAKKKGFDWPTTCFYKYEKGKTLFYESMGRGNRNNYYDLPDLIVTSAPTLCHLQKWVEETTDYVVDVQFDIYNTAVFHFIIFIKDKRGMFVEKISTQGYEHRTKALEAALFETLNLIS